ncbi:MAG TPA: DinB family protein [Anaerolineales bacterium]
MFRIGLENGTEGRSQAWVLGHPGCFSYGEDGPAALEAVPKAIQDYRSWIAAHTSASWFAGEDIEGYAYQLDETWECYSINSDFELVVDGYEVNAWFRHDWKPLTAEDIQRGLLLLGWGRGHLLSMESDLSPETLDRTYPGERWSIAGILKHIGGAEWWYQDRLGLAFERRDVPEDPLARLEKVRLHLVEILPGLAGSTQVVGVSGEIWSPRKLLRRAVWHEYDHIAHIRKLL